MKCVICKHGETNPGEVTVTLPKTEATLIFKLVPAEVCEILPVRRDHDQTHGPGTPGPERGHGSGDQAVRRLT